LARMTNLIWLFDGGRLVKAVREASRMTPQEFAEALSRELGWTVPTGLLLAWEDGRHEPRPQVERAVRRVSITTQLTAEPPPEVNRREFLSRAGLLSGLIVLDPALPASAGSDGKSHPNVEALTDPRINEMGISAFWELVAAYRSAYGSTSAEKLLPPVAGLVTILLDLQESRSSSAIRRRITSLLGQAAVMAGVLSLMGRYDLLVARHFYELAETAAEESSDADLLAYARGSMSFHDVRAGRLRHGLQRLLAAEAQGMSQVSPVTSAWIASLESELHARAGDYSMSHRCLERAENMLEAPLDGMESWRGVGTFDRSKVLAYRGGNLVLLGRSREAEEVLTQVLNELPANRVKHRCTALGDLAIALAQQKEPDQAAQKAIQALELATQLRHTESVIRVRKAYVRLQPWKIRPAVIELGERLAEAI
jgi:tetratricopeptide (TPR) repeat protein